jgi:hypothetical protein
MDRISPRKTTYEIFKPGIIFQRKRATLPKTVSAQSEVRNRDTNFRQYSILIFC